MIHTTSHFDAHCLSRHHAFLLCQETPDVHKVYVKTPGFTSTDGLSAVFENANLVIRGQLERKATDCDIGRRFAQVGVHNNEFGQQHKCPSIPKSGICWATWLITANHVFMVLQDNNGIWCFWGPMLVWILFQLKRASPGVLPNMCTPSRLLWTLNCVCFTKRLHFWSYPIQERHQKLPPR